MCSRDLWIICIKYKYIFYRVHNTHIHLVRYQRNFQFPFYLIHAQNTKVHFLCCEYILSWQFISFNCGLSCNKCTLRIYGAETMKEVGRILFYLSTLDSHAVKYKIRWCKNCKICIEKHWVLFFPLRGWILDRFFFFKNQE